MKKRVSCALYTFFMQLCCIFCSLHITPFHGGDWIQRPVFWPQICKKNAARSKSDSIAVYMNATLYNSCLMHGMKAISGGTALTFFLFFFLWTYISRLCDIFLISRKNEPALECSCTATPLLLLQKKGRIILTSRFHLWYI